MSIKKQWNKDYTKVLRYSQTIIHNGLNKSKELAAKNKLELNTKVSLQLNEWDDQWKKVKGKMQQEEKEKELKQLVNDENKDIEKQKTRLNNILKDSLTKCINIEDFLIKDKIFNEKQPIKPMKMEEKEYPPKPSKDEKRFQPKLGILDYVISYFRRVKTEHCEQMYIEELEKWKAATRKIDDENFKSNAEYIKQFTKWENEMFKWNKRKDEFYVNINNHNKKIKLIYDYYKKYILEGVENYFSLILSKIEIPLNYKKEYELKYDKDSKILILNYTLPNLKSIPNIKEYKYIKTDKKVKDISMSKKMLEELYDDTLYKISLSIIHQIFNADKEGVLSAISLNGIVNVLNKAIGKRENRYILSVQVEKEKFKDINLDLVDPKICFKNLGGIACAKLSSITPIKPILTICKEDERFIDRKNILDYLENTVNLAMIDWQDFEHLMAEFFEKEFKEGDTEVKVTRSSKDGGVDAVIFDSNPIKGGKIVVQAKRYTNLVPVSAVRDLYGTVVNEGANKGILVTTSSFGPDAYKFALNKPLTLMSGGELLYRLRELNYNFRIDLHEAKRCRI